MLTEKEIQAIFKKVNYSEVAPKLKNLPSFTNSYGMAWVVKDSGIGSTTVGCVNAYKIAGKWNYNVSYRGIVQSYPSYEVAKEVFLNLYPNGQK